MEPSEIWNLVFETVRKELAIPMVWLAMQAVKPLGIDGNFFVAALPLADKYMASHLQDDQASSAIEDALHSITGRILAFRLIEGETLEDWSREKAHELAAETASSVQLSAAPGASPISPVTPEPAAASKSPQPQPKTTRVISPTWEKLSERLQHGYKTAPYTKYPHGQAEYVLSCIKIISDTMDVLLPPPGAPRDDAGERALAKAIERLSLIVNLDPMFLSLELLRFRESQGYSRDLTG